MRQATKKRDEKGSEDHMTTVFTGTSNEELLDEYAEAYAQKTWGDAWSPPIRNEILRRMSAGNPQAEPERSDGRMWPTVAGPTPMDYANAAAMREAQRSVGRPAPENGQEPILFPMACYSCGRVHDAMQSCQESNNGSNAQVPSNVKP